MIYTLLRNLSALAVMDLAVMIFAQGVPSAGQSLTISVDSVELPLDRVGEVKNKGDGLEIKDRRYEGELGVFPTNINGTGFQADEIKVISELKIRSGVVEHRGTIDIDIAASAVATSPWSIWEQLQGNYLPSAPVESSR